MSGDVEWALNIVARQAIANAAAELEWGLYPEVGERDWLNVVHRADQVLAGLRPQPGEFKVAYALLEGRASSGKDGV